VTIGESRTCCRSCSSSVSCPPDLAELEADGLVVPGLALDLDINKT
jgi:hypothetical protein